MNTHPGLPPLRPIPHPPARPGLARANREIFLREGNVASAARPLALAGLLLVVAVTIGWSELMREVPLGSRPNEIVARWAGLAAEDAPPLELRAAFVRPRPEPRLTPKPQPSGATCPTGWSPVGRFKITRYVLARERDFPTSPVVDDPCGLEGSYRAGFLQGSGVPMQGSGVSMDGTIVRTTGGGCFEEAPCPLTATGTCAEVDRTVAVDPNVLSLGSPMWIEGVGYRMAEDVGGLVKGRHIDVYEGAMSLREARRRGTSRRLVCVGGG